MKTRAYTETGLQQLHSGDCLPGSWGQLRQAFVERQGWDSGESGENDAYDQNPKTRHFLYFAGTDIMVGMRLTPIGSYTESLSVAMMGENKSMQNEIINCLREIEGRCQMFDLTRLVAEKVDGNEEVQAQKQRIAEMLGAGLAFSLDKAGQREVRWVYAVTQQFFLVLRSMGIKQSVIASGFATPEDEINRKITKFCCTDPIASLESLANMNPRLLTAVNSGLEGANSL